MSETAQDGKVVILTYTLRDEQGNVLDSADETRPFAYIHGANNVVPGFEALVAGKAPGEEFGGKVPPELGYGERSGPGPQAIKRRDLPKEMDLREGMAFRAEGSDGKPVVLWITKIAGSRVWIDTNHPLAGQTLDFSGKVLGIRDPTMDERQHGHAHGPDGHAHHH